MKNNVSFKALKSYIIFVNGISKRKEKEEIIKNYKDNLFNILGCLISIDIKNDQVRIRSANRNEISEYKKKNNVEVTQSTIKKGSVILTPPYSENINNFMDISIGEKFELVPYGDIKGASSISVFMVSK